MAIGSPLHVSWESPDPMPMGTEAEEALDLESSCRPTEHQRYWKYFHNRYNLRALDGWTYKPMFWLTYQVSAMDLCDKRVLWCSSVTI
jgi:hypothetical protein